MKLIRNLLATIFLVAILCTVSFASSGFNAGLTVDRSASGVISVTVEDSSVLHEKVPTLTIPADASYENAMVFFEGTACAVSYADNSVSFKVAKGGTYYIVAAPGIPEYVAPACAEAGSNTYTFNGGTYVEVLSATGVHSYTTKVSSEKASDATCTEAAVYYIQCDNCDAVSETETVSVGEENGHDFSDTSKKTCANCSVANPNYEAPYVPPYIPPVTPTPNPEPDPEPEVPSVSVGSTEIPTTNENGVVGLDVDTEIIMDLIAQAGDAAEITLDFTEIGNVSSVIISDVLTQSMEQAGIMVTVVLPYEQPADTNSAEPLVKSVAEDGAVTYVATSYENSKISFTVGVAGTYSVHLCPSASFDDMGLNKWYHEAADYMIENGFMIGIGGDHFAPDDIVDRASLAMILWRMEGKPAAKEACKFSDVNPNAWYAEAVTWATEVELIAGYDDGLCHPSDVLTREQMVTILWRYTQWKGNSVEVSEDTSMETFSDASTVSGFACEAMTWAIEHGIIEGTDKGLEPKLGAGRSQIAAIIYRYNQK